MHNNLPWARIHLDKSRFDRITAEKTESARSGQPIIRHPKFGAIHSPINPVAEAKKWATNQSVSDYSTLIILGLGMGYAAAELSQQPTKWFKILIFEDDLATFKTCLNGPMGPLLANNLRVHFFVGDCFAQLHQFLGQTSALFLGPIQVVEIPKLTQRNPSFYRAVSHVIQHARLSQKASIQTDQLYSQPITHHALTNLTHIPQSMPAKSWKNQYQGIPAVCIGAGPSLTQQLTWIKSRHPHRLVVATDTSLPVLYRHKIKPHFVVSLDFHDHNLTHFEGLFDWLSDVPLVALLRTHSDIVSRYKGPLFWVHAGSGIESFLLGQSSTYPSFPGIGNVTHLALKWAQYLGCTPILMAGLNLCTTPTGTYAKGTRHTPKKEIILNGKPYLELGQTTSGDKKITQLFPVTTVSKKPAQATPAFLRYAQQIEQDLAQTKWTVVNTTTEALPIRGIKTETQPNKLDQIVSKNPVTLQTLSNPNRLNDLWPDFETHTQSLRGLLKKTRSQLKTSHPSLTQLEQQLLRHPAYAFYLTYHYREHLKLAQTFYKSLCEKDALDAQKTYLSASVGLALSAIDHLLAKLKTKVN